MVDDELSPAALAEIEKVRTAPPPSPETRAKLVALARLAASEGDAPPLDAQIDS